MKKMLFVIPWSGFYVDNADCDFADAPERAPEGVVGLATWLSKEGASVKVADMQRILRGCKGKVEEAMKDLWSICLSFAPDVIGFSFFTARFEYAAHIYEKLIVYYQKDKRERPLIVAGGVHPTLLPQLTFQYIPFDALIIGEGEIPLRQLLSGVPLANIKGCFLPEMKEAVKADVIEDLDVIPFPNWNLVDIDFYTQPSHQISNTALHRVMPITFSRSCMYRCNFCAHSCFLYARHHSPEYFVKKLESVSKQCGVNTFVIQDSSIGNFREDWEKVCEILIDRNTPYQWWANLRANQADESFLRLMKKAGCIKLFFGFESGSQRVLDRMNKRITIENCLNAAELCHKIEIPFYTSYIVNYFGEEESDLQLTKELILKTSPTSLAINKFSPIPGSRDYDENEAMIKPYIKTLHDWTTLGMLISPVLFGNMPPERFEYWYNHLRTLKKNINQHETAN